MDNRQRALNYLGLARRGNNLVYGEETVGAACRAGHGRLLLLAKDAADNTFRRARTFTQTGKPPMIRVPFTKDELGAAIGCNACAICLLTDVALAKAFVEALDEPAHYAQLLADLEARVERVKKRRMEEKAHEKNLRHGGKKRK
ncbi:MAG: 50S ribosomal protein L7 [Candidatus Avoscillospira sp.]